MYYLPLVEGLNTSSLYIFCQKYKHKFTLAPRQNIHVREHHNYIQSCRRHLITSFCLHKTEDSIAKTTVAPACYKRTTHDTACKLQCINTYSTELEVCKAVRGHTCPCQLQPEWPQVNKTKYQENCFTRTVFMHVRSRFSCFRGIRM